MVSVIQQEPITPLSLFSRQMYITADIPAVASSLNNRCGKGLMCAHKTHLDKHSWRRNFWSSRDVKGLPREQGHFSSIARNGLMSKKAPKKPLVIPWTSGLLFCQASLLDTAWSAEPGIAKITDLSHKRDLGKRTDLGCNKGQIEKPYPEFHGSHVVFLLKHIYQFFLQVLLCRVLDVNVVALRAGEVTAYTLREEIGHHSLAQWLQVTSGKK